MGKIVEINYLDFEKNIELENEIKNVYKVCFEEENLLDKYLYINVILTNGENIRKINKKHRNIDKETDVLSFPMFEKKELKQLKLNHEEVLGDVVISIEQVEKQAIEYEHSFEREFYYMLVHGFYHLLGFDHIKEEDKKLMREHEEKILNILKKGSI